VAKDIIELLKNEIVIGDGGYLIELERRGYVRSSGQFTPEISIEHPEALLQLHQEFRLAGAMVLQALTFFGTREKLTRAGYGAQTEAINRAAVRIAKDAGGDQALVAGSVSRTQLFEREGPSASGHVKDLFDEQIAWLQDAGVDFLILETFFRLDEMLIALRCARKTGLPVMATFSFRPTTNFTSDQHPPEVCARVLASEGANIVGANCEQEPSRMLPIIRAMRSAVSIPIAAQPAAFRTTDNTPCFTRLPQFPDELETIHVSRREFQDFAAAANDEGIRYLGGCCGCNAAYIRCLAHGTSRETAARTAPF
jgi:betaine-homocysteine S-methyltransferase